MIIFFLLFMNSDLLIFKLQVIGNQLSQYGSSTFYKGLLFKIPTNIKSENGDQNATKTNESIFEDNKKCQPER